MKLIRASFAFAAILLPCCSGFAQTLTLQDSVIVQPGAKRIGLNVGVINSSDNGQILKYLVSDNFEPVANSQIWTLTTAGTTSSFTIPSSGDPVPVNYWTGGSFSVVSSHTNVGQRGCAGSIASNTGPNYPVAAATASFPVVTIGTYCSEGFAAGDIIILQKSTFPTPESWLENSLAGFFPTISNGGKLTSDTTDLCPDCGTQALTLDASAVGSSSSISYHYDNNHSTNNIFVLMNGTFEISFWAKIASGAPVLSVQARRGSTDGFNCGTKTTRMSSSWALYTFTCEGTETAGSTLPGSAALSLTATNGSVYLDNVVFQKTGTDPANTTVLRDEAIKALTDYFQNASGGNPGVLRYSMNQNGESMPNWIAPFSTRAPRVGGTKYFQGPNGTGLSSPLSLHEFLEICASLNAEPYIEVPATFSATDAGNLMQYLAGPTSTAYGALRSSLGQPNPWTQSFSMIHLSFCPSCWDALTYAGQAFGNRTSAAPYTDYSVRAGQIFSAMRASGYYTPGLFDLTMVAQTASNLGMDAAVKTAHPDSIALTAHTYKTVNDSASDMDLWGAAVVEPYNFAFTPAEPSHFYQSVHDYQALSVCGATGTALCKVNVEEWGNATTAGSIDQTHLDYITAGAGQGLLAAFQPLLQLQTYGIVNQTYTSLVGSLSSGPGGEKAKSAGNVVDIGGAPAAANASQFGGSYTPRPQFLALSLVNQSIIGPMYACTLTSNIYFNFEGNTRNGMAVPKGTPAVLNVPYLYSFCFENGEKRSIVLVNTDLSDSHLVQFAGSNLPSGNVAVRQYAPGSLDDLNEAPTTAANQVVLATTTNSTESASSPASISLPPYSVTALDYTVVPPPPPVPSAPTISPDGGSYNNMQLVSLADATAGATIYYTTDGSTPTVNSTTYQGAIFVTTNEVIQAVAAFPGGSPSSAVSAEFAISVPLASGSSGGSGSSAAVASPWTADASSDTTPLTIGTSGMFQSAWSPAQMPSGNFAADLTIQLGGATPDGFTILFKTVALGASQIAAYTATPASLTSGRGTALQFVLADGTAGNDSTLGLYTNNGSIQSKAIQDLTTSGLQFGASDALHAHLVYDGSTLTVTLADTTTGSSAVAQYSLNMQQALNGTSAYVGVTGGPAVTGSSNKYLGWVYSSF